jgi:hypothetical protein
MTKQVPILFLEADEYRYPSTYLAHPMSIIFDRQVVISMDLGPSVE